MSVNLIKIAAIDHIVLRVVDLQPMLDFYTNILGLTVEKVQKDIGLYQLRAGSSLIDFLTHKDETSDASAGHRPNLDHFCLGVEEFDAEKVRDYLKAEGIEVGPIENRFGAFGYGPSMYFEDPEGNVIELKSAAAAV